MNNFITKDEATKLAVMSRDIQLQQDIESCFNLIRIASLRGDYSVCVYLISYNDVIYRGKILDALKDKGFEGKYYDVAYKSFESFLKITW